MKYLFLAVLIAVSIQCALSATGTTTSTTTAATTTTTTAATTTTSASATTTTASSTNKKKCNKANNWCGKYRVVKKCKNPRRCHHTIVKVTRRRG
ncbi:hypothetical protein KR009_006427 [Drosophila setifemur]|nr:hypothetical protein KR009_006427 [Drosophila setifemur]